jgi:hypothetical protein
VTTAVTGPTSASAAHARRERRVRCPREQASWLHFVARNQKDAAPFGDELVLLLSVAVLVLVFGFAMNPMVVSGLSKVSHHRGDARVSLGASFSGAVPPSGTSPLSAGPPSLRLGRSGLAIHNSAWAPWTGVTLTGNASAKAVLTGGFADRRTTRKLFSLVDSGAFPGP